AIAANTVFRSLVGTFLALGRPMYEALGLRWGNTLLGFICIAMVPFPLIFHKCGDRLRERRMFVAEMEK
ncbi:hypothetical protein BGZ61DRAFT_367951, partial [Ilyonectria robusta]|uniref:uncharacterized protein n=1 Tax=Ilyonectria robusta TaxID=1079257 RepID=UPI001E8D1997